MSIKKYQLSLLAMCEALHMDNQGTSDALSDIEYADYVDHLAGRLEDWGGNTCCYDGIVFALIEITLLECVDTGRVHLANAGKRG